MKTSALRSGLAALAATAVLLTAGCTSDGPTDGPATPTTEQSPSPDGPVEVPDVTLLLLETAEGNLMRVGLTTEVVDEAGSPVPDGDATAWVVTAQDPADGTVDSGSTVTLTVKPRG